MNTYRAIDGEYETVVEIKKSKFIATVFGPVDADGAENFVKGIKKKYPDATHNCYAYISDIHGQATRFSDDGEPSGTAGQPILEVLRRRGIVKSAVVVTRYFGGIKLGAGGLVGAYAGTASDALDNAVIAEYTKCVRLRIRTRYVDFAQIESFARRKSLELDEIEYAEDVTASIWVVESDAEKISAEILSLTSGKVVPEISGAEFRKVRKQ